MRGTAPVSRGAALFTPVGPTPYVVTLVKPPETASATVATPVVITWTPLLVHTVVTVCRCVPQVHPVPVGPQPFQPWPWPWPVMVLNHGLPL